MLLRHKCTTCGDVVGEDEFIHCDICDRDLHEACETYETKFDCVTCGDEPWIGAVEF